MLNRGNILLLEFFGHFFPENCSKLKKKWTKVVASLVPPFRSTIYFPFIYFPSDFCLHWLRKSLGTEFCSDKENVPFVIEYCNLLSTILHIRTRDDIWRSSAMNYEGSRKFNAENLFWKYYCPVICLSSISISSVGNTFLRAVNQIAIDRMRLKTWKGLIKNFKIFNCRSKEFNPVA